MYCTPCDNADFCYCSVVVVVFVVSCNWFFPANHKSVSSLFTCILYCFAFLLLREAFLRMRIPSYSPPRPKSCKFDSKRKHPLADDRINIGPEGKSLFTPLKFAISRTNILDI